MRLNPGILLFIFVTGAVAFSTKLAAESLLPDNMFVDMLEYARLADAAYEDQAHIEASLKASAFTLNRYENLPGHEVSYFLATSESRKLHIIGIRGTANVDNALLDIAIQLVANNDIQAQLHEGFAGAAAGIFARVKADLKKGYRIRVTGHSLGGAVAMILAMYLDKENFPVDRVVTFGQPKVTNITGALRFVKFDIWRVVTEQDLVPLLPPLDPLDINNLDVYWHIGREIILLDGNKYSIANNMESMLRATKFLNKVPNENYLLHHQMSYYLRLIEAKQNGVQQVPYENDFSIFSIFDSKQ